MTDTDAGQRAAEVTLSAAATSTPLEPLSKSTARLAGVFYLPVGIFGGFAEGFVEPKVYVAGDVAATAQNVAAGAALVRAGVVADLLDQACFVLLAATLYVLLKNVHRGVAVAMMALVTVAAAIASLNAVFLYEALQVSSNADALAALGPGGVAAMVFILVEVQHYGLLAAQVFFGLWLAPLGYLTLRSGQFPKALGMLLIIAAGCYLVDLLTAFAVPDLGAAIHAYVVIPCAVAEIWMVLYLLIIGVRAPRVPKTTTGA